MTAKPIQGFYTLRAPLYNSNDPANRVLYTFTNNDRNASAGFGYPCPLVFTQLDNVNPGGNLPVRNFFVQNRLIIKRARIVTPGAPGLQPSPGKLAATLVLNTESSKGGVDTYGNILALRFDHFNEWTEFNFIFKNYPEPGNPLPGIESDTGFYTFEIQANGLSFLNIDDYNLQSAYEGQDLYAFIEMVVDTSGLRVSGSGAVV